MKEKLPISKNKEFKPFTPPVNYEQAKNRADSMVHQMTIDERIGMIGGHNFFFVHEVKNANLPRLYLSDATQGVHIREELDNQLEKSVAMPCPIMLTSTWNRDLAHQYAKSIGEECRAGEIAVLLGPGMNLYRISQNGRNFEYFGEDPYLAARLIENYVTGVQSTGTIATLKHFVANNSDYRRRTSNSVVSERALHELYMPAFKAGTEAGAMAVMTAYNQLNGEWCGQSKYVISNLLRNDIGFKWMVMSDWWSVWNPEKAIKSGLDLDMPGETVKDWPMFDHFGDSFLRSNAKRLLDEGKVQIEDINRMASNIIATELAMELDKRPVKDERYFKNIDKHEQIALQTAREGIVLLKNQEKLLPVKDRSINILATGEIMKKRMSGGGSADVLGYNWINMIDALKAEFGEQINYITEPTNEEIRNADIVICATGTFDSEGWDHSFALPEEEELRIRNIVQQNGNTIIVVNSGSGIKMTGWNDHAAAILYCWYPGQMGNKALAEVVSGKVCPSGKLPITIEQQFKDSPGYPYIPSDEKLYSGWDIDTDMSLPVYDIEYNEGVLIGYRWYESKKIKPLYWFGHGLSYTTFKYNNIELSSEKIVGDEKLIVSFTLENTGDVEGSEIAQLYISDVESSVVRPAKELKGFIKVKLQPDEKRRVELEIDKNDLAFYDDTSKLWISEPGKYLVKIGAASDNILLSASFLYA
ncbi:MAG TPA: glycoside hydrolase family 3 C-terminal domain-containing protein [Prolixibacteraceae bacterium]|nr:glycoside hydrolase family 3 C-terminal domain-containing protein [Prolixibacteraceae bacterium]